MSEESIAGYDGFQLRELLLVVAVEMIDQDILIGIAVNVRMAHHSDTFS